MLGVAADRPRASSGPGEGVVSVTLGWSGATVGADTAPPAPMSEAEVSNNGAVVETATAPSEADPSTNEAPQLAAASVNAAAASDGAGAGAAPGGGDAAISDPWARAALRPVPRLAVDLASALDAGRCLEAGVTAEGLAVRVRLDGQGRIVGQPLPVRDMLAALSDGELAREQAMLRAVLACQPYRVDQPDPAKAYDVVARGRTTGERAG